jgi:hypothetical protein
MSGKLARFIRREVNVNCNVLRRLQGGGKLSLTKA